MSEEFKQYTHGPKLFEFLHLNIIQDLYYVLYHSHLNIMLKKLERSTLATVLIQTMVFYKKTPVIYLSAQIDLAINGFFLAHTFS